MNIDQVRALVAEGKNSKDIAALLGSNPRAVQNFVKKHGLGPWVSKTKMLKHAARPAPDDFAELASSMSRKAVERHYKCGVSTAKRWYDETGITPPRLSGSQVVAPPDIAELAASKTIKDIAQELGVGRDAVRNMMRNAGVQKERKPVVKPAKTSVGPRKPVGTWQPPKDGYQRDMSPEGIAANILQRDRWTVFRCNEKGTPNPNGKFWIVGKTLVQRKELLYRAERAARRMGEVVSW